MAEVKIYSKYIKELFSLAMPMIMGNLGIILIGAGDVFVASRYSTNALSSISIANSIISIIFMFGVGLLVGISPLLSNFRGNRNGVKKYFLPTISFTMILAFLSLLLILACIPLIDKAGFEPVLIAPIKNYMLIGSFSVFGAYLQVALKEFLQAFEIVFFPNLLNIAGIFIHLLLDFIFVFGWFNLPPMGVTGLAIATLFSRTIFAAVLLLYCLKFMRIRKSRVQGYFKNLIKIGLPIAISVLLEVFAFNVITLVIGRVSGTYAAGQNILLTITNITFMIPVAISNAIAVKVGFANGAGNFNDVKKYSFSGIIISIGFMTMCAVSFIFFPEFFVKIFTRDPALIQICVPIMLLAGIFQVFDGLQVSLGGIFKGLKNTNIVMIGNFSAYWLIGLPLGFFLAFKHKMGLYPMWLGLTIAILTLGIMFLVVLLKKFRTLKYSSMQI